MSNDFNQGFAEGFKAGWEAAQKQAMNFAEPHYATADQTPFNPFPTEPPLARPDPNNPWTAHSRGHGRIDPTERQHWTNQLNEAGSLNIHTTTPEYDVDRSVMPHPTKVL